MFLKMLFCKFLKIKHDARRICVCFQPDRDKFKMPGILILAGGKLMFLISMKTKPSLVLRSSHINPIQIKKEKRRQKTGTS